MLNRFVFLVISISWGVVLGGCYSESGDTEPTIEISVGDSNAESDTGEVDESEGNVVSGKTIPDDFPSDIPIADYMSCETITKVRTTI